jgi:arylformamidase
MIAHQEDNMAEIHISGKRVIDLSQPIAPGIPVPPVFQPPTLEVLYSQREGHTSNVERLTMGVHVGTHVDAPYHFFSKLHTIDQLPADCLIGPAVVVDMSHKRGSVPIEAEDLRDWEARSGETIRPGDMVLLRTDHSRHWARGEEGTAYWEHGWPHLTHSAVDYLAAKPIRAIGVECFDPDRVDFHDLSTTDHYSHRAFLPRGILVVENLAHLDEIPGARCQVIALPLKIEGASGSPVRVIAVV